MEPSGDRYEKAVGRNLAELQKAILNRSTLLGFEDAGSVGHTFLRVTRYALFNDYIDHCAKVFELGSQCASFWYIHRTDERPIAEYFRRADLPATLEGLRVVSEKLKSIRDKTHFHIDPVGVMDAKAIWRDADLQARDLSNAVDVAWGALTHVQRRRGFEAVTLPSYGRRDAKRAVLLVENGT